MNFGNEVRVAQQSYLMALIIGALEELGPEEVTQAVKEKIKDALAHEQPDTVQQDALTGAAWIRSLIKELNPYTQP